MAGGDAAEAIACDAAMAPVVTGDVDSTPWRTCPAVRRTRRSPDGGTGNAGCGLRRAGAGGHRQRRRPAVGSRRAGVVPAPPAARGPAGRAEPAAGHRVPRDIPPGIRNAVVLRDHSAGSPAAATSPRRRAKSTTPTRPTGARPAPPTASCSAPSITRSRSTAGAGPSSSIPDGTQRRGTRTRPRCCTATAHRPGPGNRRVHQRTARLRAAARTHSRDRAAQERVLTRPGQRFPTGSYPSPRRNVGGRR